MSRIAVVIPTIREDSFREFTKRWRKLFIKHKVHLIVVFDGDDPVLHHYDFSKDDVIVDGHRHKAGQEWGLIEFLGKDAHLIYNKSDCVRNFGFAYCNHLLVEYIVTLDDDVYPIEGTDPIQEHIDALNMKVPISWLSTASEFMRGFPYEIRDEAPVMLSHGVWDGVKDYDAPTQLVNGNKDVEFYKGPIPKGVFYPMCIMNVAFRKKMLPYMYQAPMGYRAGLDRFADIWSGIMSKKALDHFGWAVVSGYSKVFHSRASNVYTNLVKEAKGIGLNETFWKGDTSDPYFKKYYEAYHYWVGLMGGESVWDK